jgi:septal ring factor EnvC (AmiA/AmiB activator)
VTDPHEQNVRDLKMIREDPGWALTAVQEWRRAQREIERLTEMLAAGQTREKKLARDYATLERHVADVCAARNRTQPGLKT